MHPRVAFHRLEAILDRFEQALYDGEVPEIDEVLEACQNFQACGQNFDDRLGPVDDTGPAGWGQGPAELEAHELETLRERLARLIQAVEMTQESIMDELRAIERGRRGLRGYQSLQAIASEQYISICH